MKTLALAVALAFSGFTSAAYAAPKAPSLAASMRLAAQRLRAAGFRDFSIRRFSEREQYADWGATYEWMTRGMNVRVRAGKIPGAFRAITGKSLKKSGPKIVGYLNGFDVRFGTKQK